MLNELSAVFFAAMLTGNCMTTPSALKTEVLTAADTETRAYASESVMLGDVDYDGTISSLDAASVLCEVALLGAGETGTYTVEQLCCADIDDNSMVDATDAALILGYASYLGTGGTGDLDAYLEQLEQAATEESTETVTPSDPTGLTGNIVSLTSSEQTMLASLVTLEVGSESYECQLAVASLVINRMLTSDSSLEDVIYAPNQFAVASKVASTTPKTSCVNAVNEVLKTGTTLPIYVTFFRGSYYHSWGDQVGYCVIDNTYFSYSQALKDQYV